MFPEAASLAWKISSSVQPGQSTAWIASTPDRSGMPCPKGTLDVGMKPALAVAVVAAAVQWKKRGRCVADRIALPR